MRANLYALRFEPQLAHRPRKHERRGQPAGKMAAAARVVAGFVAHHAGIVRVARAGLRGEFGIVTRTLVCVLDERTDGRAGGLAVINTRLDGRQVGFPALGGLFVAARRAALHLTQYKGFVIVDAGREAVDHHADARPMRLAENRYFDGVSPSGTHWALPPYSFRMYSCSFSASIGVISARPGSRTRMKLTVAPNFFLSDSRALKTAARS